MLKETMTRFLDLMLAGDIPHWMELWHEDAVFEYPFAPPGYPQEVSGKRALYEHFKNFPETVEFIEFTDLQMHLTRDPEILIVEFACLGRMVATGREYRQKYISVMQMSGGKILRYRDYWNPLVALEAFGTSTN